MDDFFIVYAHFEQALDEIIAGKYKTEAEELAARYSGINPGIFRAITTGFVAGLKKGLELADKLEATVVGKDKSEA